MRKIKIVEKGIKFRAIANANFDKHIYEITKVVRGRHGEVTVSWNDGANSVNYTMVEAKKNLTLGNWERIPTNQIK